MLDNGFVEMCCFYYSGSTLKGLAKSLKICPQTLSRIEVGQYRPGSYYGTDRAQYNRKISTVMFDTVTTKVSQIRKRKGK